MTQCLARHASKKIAETGRLSEYRRRLTANCISPMQNPLEEIAAAGEMGNDTRRIGRKVVGKNLMVEETAHQIPLKGATAARVIKPLVGEKLSDAAYRAILHALFNKNIPVGAFVSQGDLIQLLGIPIQPLRDALRVLEAEGLLTVHPRSGIQFLKPDLQFATNVYQYRSVLERAAARRYAETGSENEINTLIKEHNRLRTKVKQKGLTASHVKSLDDLEERFHGAMIASMRNPLIEVAARRVEHYTVLVRLDCPVTQPLVLLTIDEHLEILNACKNRDAEKAGAALSNHLQSSLQRLIGMF